MEEKEITEAAENVVEVIEIIVAVLQHRPVAYGYVLLLVGVRYRAGAGAGRGRIEMISVSDNERSLITRS